MESQNFDQSHRYFATDVPSEEVRVKIIGVGGAGTNAVDRLQLETIERVRLAAVNTDAQALAGSPLEEKVMIGRSVTRGLSTGGEAELGRKAALSDRDKISSLVGSANLVFLVAGLGGGTGSGALPVIADIAAERGAQVIAFVALPFTMEGNRRRQQADNALCELRQLCDAVIPIPNDILLQDVDDNATVLDAFAKVDAWISQGIRSICTMLFNTGMINIDFSTLKQAFIARGGKTLFGLGRGTGENYAQDALKDLFMCPLLHLPESATCADRLLVNIIGGTDLSLSRVNEIMAVITKQFNSSDSTVIGAVVDENLNQTLEICVIGTTDIGGHKRATRPAPIAVKPRDSISSPVCENTVRNLSLEPIEVASNDESKEMAASSENSALRAGLAYPTPMPGRSTKSSSSGAGKKSTNEGQGEFEFVEKEQQRGYFDNTERNLFDGQDLDVPTFLRRGIKIVL